MTKCLGILRGRVMREALIASLAFFFSLLSLKMVGDIQKFFKFFPNKSFGELGWVLATGVRKGWLKGLVSVEAEEKEEDEEDSEEYFWKAPTTRRSKKIELEEQEERQINDLDVEVEEKISSKDKNSSGTSLVPSDNSSDSSSHDSALSDYLAISKPSLSTSSVVGCPSTLSCLCCGSEGDLTDSGAECYSLKIMYTEGENAYRSPYYGISSSKDEQECSCSRNIQFRY
ncbi:hypothetical protein Avbf_10148 [Armadillidium vulgare]|nr:hypothetical protein Avbf_10148 [Armadillidium vulgare]